MIGPMKEKLTGFKFSERFFFTQQNVNVFPTLLKYSGIIQTLRNAVFGENLPLPPPLVTVRNVSKMSPPSVM